jgi:hypothetical protein
MNISRLLTLSLALAIAVFALGYVNPSFADRTGVKHNHGGDGEDPPPTIEPCDVDLCIVSVGKWHRPPAREYAEQFGEDGVDGNYTEMTSSRFGEILGTLPDGDAQVLCAAFDVVIVEWSSPKIKNLTWQRLLDYMDCGGGIIFEDPKNVEALAAGVSTIALDLHGSEGPLTITLTPVAVLTLGGPLNLVSPFELEFINQHIVFDEIQPEQPDGFLLMSFLRTKILGQLVGLYGDFRAGAGGRIVLSGLDSNYHGLVDANAPNPAAMANHYHLLWNEINWLLDEGP